MNGIKFWSSYPKIFPMSTPLQLHIGGREPKEGWTIVDISARPEVDIVANAKTLPIHSQSVDVIYASHVLEHFHYGLNQELQEVLFEWRRVLKPNGRLLISVPDMAILCKKFIEPGVSIGEKITYMRMMFGGHMNQHDRHFVGFDYDILRYYLYGAQFHNAQRVEKFDLFSDCSNMDISLNVIAYRRQGILP
jgi:predicted SAM-dependent methyltransferase